MPKKIKPLIIGLAGRSCSGKTEICGELAKNKNIVYISQDKFFKKSVDNRYYGRENWEEPHAIMYDKLIEALKNLKAGKSAYIPSVWRTEVFDRLIEPKPIIILEGFLLYTNSALNKLFDKKIFVDVSDWTLFWRRMARKWTLKRLHYAIFVAIPLSKRYEELQKRHADKIIDGNKEIKESVSEIKNYLSL